MASCSITSWQINGETVETVTDFILGGSKVTADGDCSHEMKRRLLLGRRVRQHIKKQRHYFASKGPSSQSYGFTSSHVQMWTVKKTEHQELIILNGGISEDSWESIGQQGDPTIHPKGNQSYSLEGLLRIWNSNTLATWCEELTHWKRPWSWKRLRARGEEGDRWRWDDWMASLTARSVQSFLQT